MNISQNSVCDNLLFLLFICLDLLDLSGNVIYEVFEHSVSRSFVDYEFIGIHMLQISGFRVVFNTTKSVGQRIQSLQIKIDDEQYENVQQHKFYTLIVPSFLASGGDGFTMIKAQKKNHRIGLLDIDLMEAHIAAKSPINFKETGRIIMLT